MEMASATKVWTVADLADLPDDGDPYAMRDRVPRAAAASTMIPAEETFDPAGVVSMNAQRPTSPKGTMLVEPRAAERDG